MAEHRIGTQEEWQADHAKLLEQEKELTRRPGPTSARSAGSPARGW